jgi:hypothetical protein
VQWRALEVESDRSAHVVRQLGWWDAFPQQFSASRHLGAAPQAFIFWNFNLFTVNFVGYPTLGGGVLRISAPQFSMF